MKIGEIIEKYLPFAWWVLMAILAIVGEIAGFIAGGFFGTLAIIGNALSVIIYAWQAWGEWLEKDEQGDEGTYR